MAGMWPIDDKSTICSKIFAYFRLVFGLTAVSSVLLPEIMVITSNWGDIKILAGKFKYNWLKFHVFPNNALYCDDCNIWKFFLESEVGCVLTTVEQVFFKMIYLIARKKSAYRLYNEIRALWNSSSIPKERQTYEELASWARIVTIVFYSSCMCNVFTFTIAAAVDYFTFEYNISNTDNKRNLPFTVW